MGSGASQVGMICMEKRTSERSPALMWNLTIGDLHLERTWYAGYPCISERKCPIWKRKRDDLSRYFCQWLQSHVHYEEPCINGSTIKKYNRLTYWGHLLCSTLELNSLSWMVTPGTSCSRRWQFHIWRKIPSNGLASMFSSYEPHRTTICCEMKFISGM